MFDVFGLCGDVDFFVFIDFFGFGQYQVIG